MVTATAELPGTSALLIANAIEFLENALNMDSKEAVKVALNKRKSSYQRFMVLMQQATGETEQ
jgi:hypothetical protein